jgi:hypothetical protein
MKSYLWSREYLNAIMETDPRKRRQRIRAAEYAIGQRLRSIKNIEMPEQRLIARAKTRLQELKAAAEPRGLAFLTFKR